MRILLLSAYDTDSHRSWCQGLMQHCPDINWTYLALPGRYFSWRIRGNPLSWAFGENRDTLEQEYDLILATSMVDLATLKGLIPNLASIPSVLYMHENQFAYPTSESQFSSVEPQMVNLYSALAADFVMFNSAFNQHSMLAGAKKLLTKMPDLAPLSTLEKIAKHSAILPVPIEAPTEPVPSRNTGDRPLKVIWNHRWEYDKGPEILEALITACEKQNAPISFSIAGKQFRQFPEALKNLARSEYACIDHIGTYELRADYERALCQHDVVLSTAHHEFQGLAMLEGCAHGCIPLAPDHLAYPEWVPNSCLYEVNEEPAVQADTIFSQLLSWQKHGLPECPSIDHYLWPNMAPKYRSMLVKIKEDYQA